MHDHLDEPLPTHQHRYEGLEELPTLIVHRRREGLFLLLAGLFLGTLAMLNILGITRFIVFASWSENTGLSWGQWGELSFAVAAGVLPYPLTFLCTDFISELYGRRRANLVVWIGLILNLWVIFILWFAGNLPVQGEFVSYGTNALGTEVLGPPVPEAIYDADGTFVRFSEDWTFYRLQQLAFGAVAASMIAYLIAQLVDVQVFHFWKRLTRGKHLWLRNNGSTLISQMVDTVAVILITHFYAHALPVDPDHPLARQLMIFILTGYVFKLTMALLDTLPFMFGARALARYLRLPPPGYQGDAVD
ncbi:MAG: queuosine precursor transporter [Phycisphaerales bacterium]|nr:queuosine precursor transporter [Phycisphaerales bacterium]